MDNDELMIGALICLVIAVGVCGGCREHHRYSRCHAVGGEMKQVRCRMVEDQNCTTTYDDGTGATMYSQTCMPMMSKSCETVCLLDDGQEVNP